MRTLRRRCRRTVVRFRRGGHRHCAACMQARPDQRVAWAMGIARKAQLRRCKSEHDPRRVRGPMAETRPRPHRRSRIRTIIHCSGIARAREFVPDERFRRRYSGAGGSHRRASSSFMQRSFRLAARHARRRLTARSAQIASGGLRAVLCLPQYSGCTRHLRTARQMRWRRSLPAGRRGCLWCVARHLPLGRWVLALWPD